MFLNEPKKIDKLTSSTIYTINNISTMSSDSDSDNDPQTFHSDFSLFPIRKLGHPGWSYREATWPNEMDPEVHQIFDGEKTRVGYQRLSNRTNQIQNCIVEKQPNGEVHVKPGDGWDFLVRRDSTTNKNMLSDVDDKDIPHNNICVVCAGRKQSTVLHDCGHVCMCVSCANIIFGSTKECPICKKHMSQKPIKLFYA